MRTRPTVATDPSGLALILPPPGLAEDYPWLPPGFGDGTGWSWGAGPREGGGFDWVDPETGVYRYRWHGPDGWEHGIEDLDYHPLGHFDYNAKDRPNPRVAARLINAVERTLRLLGQRPLVGSMFKSAQVGPHGVRKVRVSGFPRDLLFYRAIEGGIVFIRLIHSSRDTPQALVE